jgi:hypothetical protein
MVFAVRQLMSPSRGSKEPVACYALGSELDHKGVTLSGCIRDRENASPRASSKTAAPPINEPKSRRLTLCPFFQRSHSSAFCAAVNQIGDVTMVHLLTS